MGGRAYQLQLQPSRPLSLVNRSLNLLNLGASRLDYSLSAPDAAQAPGPALAAAPFMALGVEAVPLRGSAQRGDRLPLHAGSGGGSGGGSHLPRPAGLVLLAVAVYTLLAALQGAWWFVHLKRAGSCRADNEVRVELVHVSIVRVYNEAASMVHPACRLLAPFHLYAGHFWCCRAHGASAYSGDHHPLSCSHWKALRRAAAQKPPTQC